MSEPDLAASDRQAGRPTAELWRSLTSFSDTYTCYSSAVATWAALADPFWQGAVNAGLWLTLTEAGGDLFGFAHFPPGLRASLGLARLGSDDSREATAGISEELDRSGRIIVAGDGFHLPWHVAFERQHVPHWFVLASTRNGLLVIDPFGCRNNLGWQRPYCEAVPLEGLSSLMIGLPHDDLVFLLRESLALGDDADQPSTRFHWFSARDVRESRAPEGLNRSAAVLRLARHFREHGQTREAYRQADDLWSIARHRAFLAHYASEVAERRGRDALGDWVTGHAAPLAQRWAHVAPLLMQAVLAVDAGRNPSSSLPEKLEELAVLEAAAESAFPAEGSAGQISPAELERPGEGHKSAAEAT